VVLKGEWRDERLGTGRGLEDPVFEAGNKVSTGFAQSGRGEREVVDENEEPPGVVGGDVRGGEDAGEGEAAGMTAAEQFAEASLKANETETREDIGQLGLSATGEAESEDAEAREVGGRDLVDDPAEPIVAIGGGGQERVSLRGTERERGQYWRRSGCWHRAACFHGVLETGKADER
jgi:hypothetical protein